MPSRKMKINIFKSKKSIDISNKPRSNLEIKIKKYDEDWISDSKSNDSENNLSAKRLIIALERHEFEADASPLKESLDPFEKKLSPEKNSLYPLVKLPRKLTDKSAYGLRIQFKCRKPKRLRNIRKAGTCVKEKRNKKKARVNPIENQKPKTFSISTDRKELRVLIGT